MASLAFRFYQIQFRQGLRAGPRWGSLRRSPRPPSRLGDTPPHSLPPSMSLASCPPSLTTFQNLPPPLVTQHIQYTTAIIEILVDFTTLFEVQNAGNIITFKISFDVKISLCNKELCHLTLTKSY